MEREIPSPLVAERGVAAVISFNPKLGWIWSLRESLGHKATDEQAAVRAALAALEMEERVRAHLLAIALEEFARLRKIEAENDAKSTDSDGEEVA